jgi:hypothetical protein
VSRVAGTTNPKAGATKSVCDERAAVWRYAVDGGDTVTALRPIRTLTALKDNWCKTISMRLILCRVLSSGPSAVCT